MDPFTLGAISQGINIFSHGLNLFNKSKQARAMKRRAAFQRDMYNLNAEFSEMRAREAIRKGDKDVNQFRRTTKQLRADQRLALAMQGIDVSTGSAKDIFADTAVLNQEDELIIRSNAYKHAFGLKVDASNKRMQGLFAVISGNEDAKNMKWQGIAETAFGAADLFREYGGKY
tara:strand:+ start:487 stop:1005 length:519 start_codon:yes stop_codon:yes gene_type:complete